MTQSEKPEERILTTLNPSHRWSKTIQSDAKPSRSKTQGPETAYALRTNEPSPKTRPPCTSALNAPTNLSHNFSNPLYDSSQKKLKKLKNTTQTQRQSARVFTTRHYDLHLLLIQNSQDSIPQHQNRNSKPHIKPYIVHRKLLLS